jgi:hypothetical protein
MSRMCAVRGCHLHMHQVDPARWAPVQHVENCAPMQQPKIAGKRVPASGRDKRDALLCAVDSIEDFEQRAVATYCNHTSKRLGVARDLGCVSRMVREDGLRRNPPQARQQFGQTGVIPVAARARVDDRQPVISQDFLPLSASTRYMLPTSDFHSGRMQMSAISSHSATTKTSTVNWNSQPW